jgi:hypothetical protein
MKKKNLSLIFNILIVIGGLLGIILQLSKGGVDLIYYTNLSNIFAMIVSILFIIFYKSKKEFIKDLRFMATSCLTVTFLVVLLVLSPMYGFNYKLLMFTNVFFLFHTLCPLLSIISYLFFEERSKKLYLGFLFTLIYGVIVITLNIFRAIEGPYPFLKLYEQSIVVSVFWFIAITGGSYLIGIILDTLKTKIEKKKLN